MTRVVIAGASGMLGRDLCEVFSDLEPACLDRKQLDITNPDQVEAAVSGRDVVINAAAYTLVDQAEEDGDLAMAINADGPRLLAQACKDAGATLIHVSTDYVFRGDATKPYSENAPRDPVSAYGRSKARGEEAILQTYPEGSVIIRTAWLYGQHGQSFPRTMLTAAATRETLSVVDDQVGQPTWTKDLARQIRLLVNHSIPSGIFHGTNAGHTSWWTFARAVFSQAGLDPKRIVPTTSAEFIRPAPRPAWSVLGHDRWAAVGLPAMRNWEDALAEAFPECFSEIAGSGQ
jgi:dTDP-4-dehydrorhamnose reductase